MTKLAKKAIFLPSRSRNVSRDLDGVGCAAREQVADWLATALSDDGEEVHIFTNQDDGPEHDGFKHYVDNQMAGPMLLSYEWDAVISFDYPSILQLEEIKQTCNKVIVVQNYFEIPPEGQSDMSDLVDVWVYPSQYALEMCSEANGVDPSKGVVIPYTWDERYFGNLRIQHEGINFLYVNQAESGLAQTLRMWPRLHDEFPNSTLTVATNVEEFVEQIQWSHSIQSELALDIRDLMEQDGVRYVGRQGRRALGSLMAESDYLLFPAEPLMPSEIGSLPLVQACASGCTPIFRDTDALKELYGKFGVCVPKDHDFLDFAIPAIILDQEKEDQSKYGVFDTRSPRLVAAQWDKVLN